LKDGEEYFKLNSDLKEERVELLNCWRDLVYKMGEKSEMDIIDQKMPKKVKK